MRTCNADRVRVIRREGFEQLGARDDRHAAPRRKDHLRVVGRKCDRVDNQFRTVKMRFIGRVVNGDPAVLQHLRLPCVCAVIAADRTAAALEDHCQRGHTAAADSDEIYMFRLL